MTITPLFVFGPVERVVCVEQEKVLMHTPEFQTKPFSNLKTNNKSNYQ